MTNCKLISIHYEDNSVKLNLDLSATLKNVKLKNVEISDDEKANITNTDVEDDNNNINQSKNKKDDGDNTKIKNKANMNMIKPLSTHKSPSDVDKENMMDKLTKLKDHTYLADDDEDDHGDIDQKHEQRSSDKTSPKKNLTKSLSDKALIIDMTKFISSFIKF